MFSSAYALDSPPSLSPAPSQVTLTVDDDAFPNDGPPCLPTLGNETTSSIASPQTPVISRNFDSDFYLNGLFVIFEIEDYLFRVPAYLFCIESAYFAKLFKVPTLGDPEYVPRTIVLPAEIKREDFRNLLKALYPISVATKLCLSESEWISILKLSTKWRFNNLREMAISELESLPAVTPLDKIVLGRQCFISSWFQSGLTQIVNREATISNDEAIAMDYLTALELFRYRELRLKDPFYSLNSRLKNDIAAKFGAELASINTAAEEMGFMPTPDFYSDQRRIQVIDDDLREAPKIRYTSPISTNFYRRGGKRRY